MPTQKPRDKQLFQKKRDLVDHSGSTDRDSQKPKQRVSKWSPLYTIINSGTSTIRDHDHPPKLCRQRWCQHLPYHDCDRHGQLLACNTIRLLTMRSSSFIDLGEAMTSLTRPVLLSGATSWSKPRVNLACSRQPAQRASSGCENCPTMSRMLRLTHSCPLAAWIRRLPSPSSTLFTTVDFAFSGSLARS